MERKNISKKLRFEVYKRDSFTCQYCGRKAPDVVLNIDHIVPVSKGGTNEILNLITSCFECNNGKSNTPLIDESVLNKQRLQLEQLQERREQIEMMFDWKKSLENLGDFTSDLLAEYVESKIIPYTLNETGKRNLSSLLKKFDIDEIFDAIDQGVRSHLRYGTDGQLTKDSVETFLNKLGGIASYRKLPLVEQKMHYIKGICKNRFGYWDDKKGLAILRTYIKALRDYGWADDKILQDLEHEVSDLAKTAKNWTEWRETMEGWTQDIYSWDRESDDSVDVESGLELSEITEIAKEVFNEILKLFELMDYLSVPFGIQKVDRTIILKSMQQYIDAQVTAFSPDGDIRKLEPNYQICRALHLFDTVERFTSDLTFMIEYMFSEFAITWTNDNLYLPSRGLSNAKDATIFKQFFDQYVLGVNMPA